MDLVTPSVVAAGTAAIRAEAARWDEFGDRMDTIRAGTLKLTVPQLGFAVADVSGALTSVDQWRVYDAMHTHLCTLFADATVQFHAIAAVLRRCAAQYEDADRAAVQDLDTLWRA